MLAAHVALGQRDQSHIAGCRSCQAAVEQDAWFDRALERVVPSLAAEPIPRAILAVPAVRPIGGVPSWHRSLFAMAAATGIVVVAAFVSSQLADLISRSGPFGSGATAMPAATPAPSRTIECGAPTAPGAPAVLTLDDLGGLPRVAMVAEGEVVIAMFAAERDSGHAYALCTWFTDLTPPVSSGSSGAGADVPSEGSLRLIVAHRAAATGEAWTAYGGVADVAVSQVRVALSDGSTQMAHLGDGYFVIAWPGEEHATGFTALGESGDPLHAIGNAGWDFSDWQSP
jgi:hypothetical protein